MKLQAGDRIWINDSDFMDVILQIHHDFEEYGLCVPLWVDQIFWEHNIEETLREFSLYGAPRGVFTFDPGPNTEHHILEQLYAERAFPWQ